MISDTVHTKLSLSELMDIDYASLCASWSFYCNLLIFLSSMKRTVFYCLFMIRDGVSYAKCNQLFYLTLFPCMLK